jgi:hypothetical protein
VPVVFALSAPFGFPRTGRGFDNLVAATQSFDAGAILACSSTLYARGPRGLELCGRRREDGRLRCGLRAEPCGTRRPDKRAR